jgi:hypothetical protein
MSFVEHLEAHIPASSPFPYAMVGGGGGGAYVKVAVGHTEVKDADEHQAEKDRASDAEPLPGADHAWVGLSKRVRVSGLCAGTHLVVGLPLWGERHRDRGE